jgi:hypothetical protein
LLNSPNNEPTDDGIHAASALVAGQVSNSSTMAVIQEQTAFMKMSGNLAIQGLHEQRGRGEEQCPWTGIKI